jgi:hypothetical protein
MTFHSRRGDGRQMLVAPDGTAPRSDAFIAKAGITSPFRRAQLSPPVKRKAFVPLTPATLGILPGCRVGQARSAVAHRGRSSPGAEPPAGPGSRPKDQKEMAAVDATTS